MVVAAPVTVAFLFPGQGSQRVGMGHDLCEAYPEIGERYFQRADRVLGFGLSSLCFEGPEDELLKTENQQPAIYLVSVAMNAVLQAGGVTPAAVAGHSLGEYSALASTGALPWEDGLRLTRRRGELMAGVAARTGGIMAAVLGLPAQEVEAACREAATLGVAEVANYNSPAQSVVSGEVEAVRRVMDLVKERGARRAVELPVSAPFHCSLMAPLADAFAPELEVAPFAQPHVPVIANVTAAPEHDPDEIRRNLVTQLASAVRWTESVRRLIADGCDTVIEVGPGKVLTGLMRAIDPEVTAFATNTPVGIDAAVQAVAANSQ